MKDGNYIYYTIQHRSVSRSPWLKPEEPLVPATIQQWCFSSWDHFGASLDPHTGTGNEWHAVDKAASNEIHTVWSLTGSNGWWTLRFAIAALKQIRKDDSKGKYDCFDSYKNHQQAIRHEFRIMKLTVSQKTEVIDMHNDVLEVV
jgi:hypothetical protein